MGDRANVYIREDAAHGVYLYTHWSGNELPEIVRAALDSPAGRGRWSDTSYLARIVFCRMVGPENLNEATGYGISARIGDNSYRIIVVDPAGMRIGFAEPPVWNDETHEYPSQADPETWQTFEQYCKRKPAAWPQDEDEAGQ